MKKAILGFVLAFLLHVGAGEKMAKPDSWFLKYASTEVPDDGGIKFILNTDTIPKTGKALKLETASQDVFLWNKSLGAQIRSNAPKLAFAVTKSDGNRIEVTAYKDKDLNSGRGRYGHNGKYAWEGTIFSSDDPDHEEPQGELTISFAWGEMDCKINIFDKEIDSVYEVIMEEGNMFAMANLKEDLADDEDDADEDSNQEDIEQDSDEEEEDEDEDEGEDKDGNDSEDEETGEDVEDLSVGGELLDEDEETDEDAEDFDEEDRLLKSNILFEEIDSDLQTEEDPQDGDGHGGLRRLGKTHLMAGKTDLIVFYTKEAAKNFGSASALEREIELSVEQFNEALHDVGVKEPQKYLNLVSTWYLYKTPDWVGSTLKKRARKVRKDFVRNLGKHRNRVRADAMMLIHDWRGGIGGEANKKGPEVVLSMLGLRANSFYHELDHTYNVGHCHGAIYKGRRNYSSSLMAYRPRNPYHKRLVKWDNESGKFFRTGTAKEYTEISPFAKGAWKKKYKKCKAEDNLRPGEHCCKATGRTIKLNKVWNKKVSRSASRVNPGTLGNVKGRAPSWLRRRKGFAGLGLELYSYGYHRLVVVQRNGKEYKLGKKGKGVRLQKPSILKCKKGQTIEGVSLRRYRLKKNAQHRYQLGIKCTNSRGYWKFTPKPKYATLVGWDSTVSGKTSNKYGRSLKYVKWNRFKGPTYNLDVAFK